MMSTAINWGPNPAIKAYESDGSDGYTEGTWGVIVTMARLRSCDGGWGTRELAEERGRELWREMSRARIGGDV